METVMNKEIERKDRKLYNQIASQYLLKDLTPYCSLARKLRLKQTLKRANASLDHILEIGCGTGFTARYIQNTYTSYTGIDYSKKLIELAKENNQLKNTTFICKNIKEFNSSRKFDTIIMIGVLHHITEKEITLNKLKTLLNPDGKIIINEPKNSNPIIQLLRKIRTKIDDGYSDSQSFFSESELAKLFKNNGYTVNTYPQGILTTPLAEIATLPNFLFYPITHLLIKIDPILENLIHKTKYKKISWNIILEAKLNSTL
jgi:2-polyprenyl-3-methyl-5-hydroxy-6-metoxy-1,4-benzoquinol methylase